MNKICVLLLVLTWATEGCASECLYVHVTDNDGVPISNATVNVSYTSGHIILSHCSKIS